MSRPVCLVTGATGAIGPRVVAAMTRTHEVRTLSRRSPASGLFETAVTPYVGDVAEPDVLRRAAEGANVIVHLAALLHIVDPPVEMRSEYERVNVRGTSLVLEVARTQGVDRVVLMSTIAVYGYGGERRLDEESPTRPETFYGGTKLQAERLALTATRADGSPLATVLRSAAVYGPRVKGNYQRLVTALARGRFVPIGRGDNLRTLVYEDDLASAAALAAGHPAARGRIYNVTDGTPHRLSEIISVICAALGRRPPRWHAPATPVRAALRAASIVNHRLPRMLDKYLEQVNVDGSRIQTELGFRPAVSLLDGWRYTIETMRREGRL